VKTNEPLELRASVTLGFSGQRRYEQVHLDAILRQGKCAEADDARTTFGNNCHYDLFINSLH